MKYAENKFWDMHINGYICIRKTNIIMEISEFVQDIIEEKVSAWFNNHCTSEDFDGDYERKKYLDSLSDRGDDIEDVIDAVYYMVIEEVDEDEEIDDEEMREAIADAIVSEADFYLMRYW